MTTDTIKQSKASLTRQQRALLKYIHQNPSANTIQAANYVECSPHHAQNGLEALGRLRWLWSESDGGSAYFDRWYVRDEAKPLLASSKRRNNIEEQIR